MCGKARNQVVQRLAACLLLLRWQIIGVPTPIFEDSSRMRVACIGNVGSCRTTRTVTTGRGLCSHNVPPEQSQNSLPEFLDFVLFGKTMSVVTKKVWIFVARPREVRSCGIIGRSGCLSPVMRNSGLREKPVSRSKDDNMETPNRKAAFRTSQRAAG